MDRQRVNLGATVELYRDEWVCVVAAARVAAGLTALTSNPEGGDAAAGERHHAGA
ncbi:hypothetical protein [Actinomadura nitritigenes]|uniref:hypothetical protein n=1 Tax=Actinomadura nitritigenes TaxID=134602 RepID=UPI003D903413